MSTIPEGYAEVTLHWKIATSTEPVLNVFGIAWDGAPSLDAVCSDITNYVNTDLLSVLSENIQLEAVTAIDGDNHAGHVDSVAVGELDYPIAPPNVTHLITKRTGFSGRANQGRMYLPGVDEANVNAGGQIDVTRQGVITDAMDNFLSELNGAEYGMYILHAPLLTDPGPPPVYTPNPAIPVLVSTLTCQLKVATQRRRLR